MASPAFLVFPLVARARNLNFDAANEMRGPSGCTQRHTEFNEEHPVPFFLVRWKRDNACQIEIVVVHFLLLPEELSAAGSIQKKRSAYTLKRDLGRLNGPEMRTDLMLVTYIPRASAALQTAEPVHVIDSFLVFCICVCYAWNTLGHDAAHLRNHCHPLPRFCEQGIP